MANDELKAALDAVLSENRRHFEAYAERIEKRLDVVAEGVGNLAERIDTRTRDLETRMLGGFADTQAMIKFSHAELDRRVRALEDNLAEVRTRLDRLEESTH